MPMDFRSSVVQILKRDWTEGQMVSSPAAAHRVASAMMVRGGNFDENRVDTDLKTLWGRACRGLDWNPASKSPNRADIPTAFS